MYESGEELLHPEEIQSRFKKVFGREMTQAERDIFFLPVEPSSAQEDNGWLKTKELTLKQINSVRCTTCGAATGEPCELHSGALRLEPHRDRKLSAADALEAKRNKRQAAI